MDELKIVFMGTPQFGVVPLDFLVNSDYTVIGVYTQQDKAAGRGQTVTTSPVKKAAQRHNLAIYQPGNLKAEEPVAELAALKPDLIITAAYGQILSPRVLGIPRFGCINIHPSLLPLYRGVSPVPASILAGDEFTGVTLMVSDQGIDTGPILAQAMVPVLAQDTTGTLTDNLSVIGAQLLVDLIPRWTAGQLQPRTQDNTQATYCRKIAKEDGEINWNLPASVIWRQTRAYAPWPGSFTRWQGKQLKILAAKPMATAGGGRAGEVIPVKDKEIGFGIVTGENVLGVTAVQYEGKRAMAAAEFARGQREFAGAVLPG